METRIIKAVFGASKSIVAPKRFKNDWGQVLELVGIELPQVFEAHFSNSKTGTAKKRVGQDNRVEVPAEYFKSGADIFCWVMVHDEATDGRTMYTVRIPIEDRGTATDEEPTPVQQDVIEQAIAALNSAVEQTGQDVESADASAQSASDSADRAETARDTAEGYVNTVQGYAQQAQASANNASASATASANSASQAQQMKTDVQELVSDAQSAAGASAQSALESDQSASQASTFATFASQSAETASTKASEASASAQTAGAKATESSGYASTASAKASESSQSASAANGYATQAGQAKTAAETAQGLAEQAQSDAESAKDDAESARDEAQQIVSGISSKVEQIDQNTADIASLEADRYKAYVTDTATGAVASFPDGADNIPMKDVIVAIDPVQDLHGYDNPWPAGGGVNKLSASVSVAKTQYGYTIASDGNGKYTFSGTTSGGNYNQTFTLDEPHTIVTGEYLHLMNDQSSGNITFILQDATSRIIYAPSFSGANRILDLSSYAGSIIASIRIYIPDGTTYTGTATPMIVASSSATSFSPYSNICPISGWTECNVSHSGADTSDATVYPIAFPSEAGTVYGGTLDITTGVLTVDRATVDLGTLSWDYTVSGKRFDGTTLTNLSANRTACICSQYVASNVDEGWINKDKVCCIYSTRNTAFVKDTAYTDATTFKSAMSGIQLCYELATPITYQLTPAEIRSLLGTNNVWADTGGTEVEYRANTKLWVQKKITEAVSALA